MRKRKRLVKPINKIYPPIGYKIDWKGRDYYLADDVDEIRDVVMAMASWPNETIKKISTLSLDELKQVLFDNGYEEVTE